MILLRTQYPDLIYIENGENLGFAEGNNRGLQYSIDNGYTYSLVINNDTLVDEDLVSKLKTHLDNHLQAAAVQPAIYWLHNKAAIWNGAGTFNASLGKTVSSTKIPDAYDLKTAQTVEWVTGCCMMLRNDSLLMCGLFNQRFFLYYEDVELSFRLRECGHELHYLPSGKMYHEAGASAKVQKKEGFLSPIIHYYISRNHIWFLRRFGKPAFYPLYFIYNGAYYLMLLSYFVLRGRFRKARLLIKGLSEGLFTPKSLIWSNNNIGLKS